MRWRNHVFGVMLALAVTQASAVDPGGAAPEFSLARLGAPQALTLADFRGRVVLIDFWASWCGPCRESMPLYDKLRAEFAPSDFEIIAINLDEAASDAEGFLAKHPVTYPIALDPDGATAKAFGLIGMPSSYLVDQAGVVRARHTGFEVKGLDELRGQIRGLLGATRAQ